LTGRKSGPWQIVGPVTSGSRRWPRTVPTEVGPVPGASDLADRAAPSPVVDVPYPAGGRPGALRPPPSLRGVVVSGGQVPKLAMGRPPFHSSATW
jgi:hypothetical protein